MHICIAHGGDLSEPSGGTDRVTAFATGLEERGFDVTVVVASPRGKLSDRLANVNVVTVPMKTHGVLDQPARAALVVQRARTIARKRETTLQFEHSTLGGAAAMFGCSKFVLDMHDIAHPSPLYGDLPFGEFIQRAVHHVEARAMNEAEEIVVVSEQMRDMSAQEWGVPKDRFTVIPNGYFGAVVDRFRSVTPIPGRVVFFGTLHPKVDVETLIEVAQLNEVSELYIIGDGARHRDIKEACVHHGIQNVMLTGRLPDEEAFELLSSASLAVNPQHSSQLQRASSPVKLFYYAALGIPMVVTEGPDVAEALAEAGAAVTIPPHGPFADQVQEILRDGELRAKMSRCAIERSRETRWEARIDSLVELYERIQERQ